MHLSDLRYESKIKIYQFTLISVITSLILVLIIGEGDDYLTVSLRDGGAAVGMTLAKGRLDLHIKPARVRFDDNQWHKIIVHRKVQEVMFILLLICLDDKIEYKQLLLLPSNMYNSIFNFNIM